MFGYGFFLLMFSLSRSVPLSLAMLGMAYGIAIVYETVVNTMLQTGVPYHMRGRVLSFQGMLWGVTGMTGFHTGAISTFFGAPLAIGGRGGHSHAERGQADTPGVKRRAGGGAWFGRGGERIWRRWQGIRGLGRPQGTPLRCD